MKITKELKLVLQWNSFVGMCAAAFLIKSGVQLPIAYSGFALNGLCLVYWIFVKETDTDGTHK